MRRAGFESSSDSTGQACFLSPGTLPSIPIFHVRGLVPGSPNSVSLGKMSLIYFRLDSHALRKDYRLADSNCAYFFCLICSGFITQVLQPILALLGLWECQGKVLEYLSRFLPRILASPFSTPPHPDAPFHLAQAKPLPLRG